MHVLLDRAYRSAFATDGDMLGLPLYYVFSSQPPNTMAYAMPLFPNVIILGSPYAGSPVRGTKPNL